MGTTAFIGKFAGVYIPGTEKKVILAGITSVLSALIHLIVSKNRYLLRRSTPSQSGVVLLVFDVHRKRMYFPSWEMYTVAKPSNSPMRKLQGAQ